jgi:hypothetical protein
MTESVTLESLITAHAGRLARRFLAEYGIQEETPIANHRNAHEELVGGAVVLAVGGSPLSENTEGGE